MVDDKSIHWWDQDLFLDLDRHLDPAVGLEYPARLHTHKPNNRQHRLTS